MATNQQTINYEKLLLGNMEFKKEGDQLTIPIDSKIIGEIIEFVNDMDNKNVDYEKKQGNLVILTNKQNVNIVDNRVVDQHTELEKKVIGFIFDKLKLLNVSYGKFKHIITDGNRVCVHGYDSYVWGKEIKLVIVNGKMFIQFKNSKFITFMMPFTTIETTYPHMIYAVLCLIDEYHVNIGNNSGFAITNKKRKYRSRAGDKTTAVYYVGEDEWTECVEKTGSIIYNTRELLTKI